MTNARKKNAATTELLDFAREVLRQEAAAVSGLVDSIDDNFEAAVRAVQGMTPGGRVIVSGMGKAGFVAMKVSATLASVGVSSFFLHPAEAIHGDLGKYMKGDIALIMSNSGETPEILRLIPHIKRIGCELISITANRAANLSKHSDIVLTIGKLNEAGPLGLAPTTSTTAMLALGDALAMAVIKSRGFTRQEFALYHPGGDLGRALTLTGQIMRRDDELCVVETSEKSRDVIHKISSTKGRPGAAAVVDTEGKLVGIFTDGNLRRCLDSGQEFLDKPIGEFASKNPKSIEADKLVQEALHIMSELKIDNIIVIDENSRPIGMIDIQDLVEF